MAVFYCGDRINEKAEKIDATEITQCYQHICISTCCITRGEHEKSPFDHCSKHCIWLGHPGRCRSAADRFDDPAWVGSGEVAPVLPEAVPRERRGATAAFARCQPSPGLAHSREM